MAFKGTRVILAKKDPVRLTLGAVDALAIGLQGYCHHPLLEIHPDEHTDTDMFLGHFVLRGNLLVIGGKMDGEYLLEP